MLVLVVALLSGAVPPTASESSAALMIRARDFVNRGDIAAAERTADAAERAAAADVSIEFRARMEGLRGDIALGRGDLPSAMRRYQSFQTLAEKAGDNSLLARALSRVANAYMNESDLDRALAYANRALESDADLSAREKADLLGLRSTMYLNLSQPAAAEEGLREALALAESDGDVRHMAELHRQLGQLAWRYR